MSKNELVTTKATKDQSLTGFRHYLPLFEIIMLVIILLAIVLAINFGHNRSIKSSENSSTSSVPVTVCTNATNLPVLMAAVKDIKDNNITSLGNEVVVIKGINGYKTDPNCLYPIVYYYVNTSDYPNASAYLSDLKAVYKNNYSIYLGQTLYINALQTDVNNMKNIQKTNWSNDTAAKMPEAKGDVK